MRASRGAAFVGVPLRDILTGKTVWSNLIGLKRWKADMECSPGLLDRHLILFNRFVIYAAPWTYTTCVT